MHNAQALINVLEVRKHLITDLKPQEQANG